MNGKLVRTLSTGRTGTKFVADLFADQGFRALHEELYLGEPSSAIRLYMHMLGDLWRSDPEAYFAIESDFAKPYVQFVVDNLNQDSVAKTASPSAFSRFSNLFSAREHAGKQDVVIHTAHLTTTATPIIERELAKAEIESKNLILFRNPIKTIQAIYTVEGFPKNQKRTYWTRPVSFSQGEGLVAAANVWANTYRLAYEQKMRLGADKFRLLELEAFSKGGAYAEGVFEFLGLKVDSDRLQNFTARELNKPLRSSKQESTRNSHIFHDPDLVFSKSEINVIFDVIKDVIDTYQIDWEQSVEGYRKFHEQEKNQIGFA